VLYRRSSGIHVKFADFGLAKAADYLKTFCGSLPWAAPEIYNKVPDPKAAADDRYSVAVDIWSLGVVIASRECGLPYYEDSYRTSAVAWIRAVLQHVEGYEEKGNELLYFLLNTMLIVNPQERKGAPYCHDEALRLSNCDSRRPFLHRISRSRLNGYRSSDTNESDEDSDPGTPTPYIPGTQHSKGHEGASEESTIRLGPRADGMQTLAETTAASIDPSLIENLGYRGTNMINSIVNSTESGKVPQRLRLSCARDKTTLSSYHEGAYWTACYGTRNQQVSQETMTPQPRKPAALRTTLDPKS
jgi:serine/threonine protein kinase